ncbi:MAG: glycine cleavage system aminomethyltransferase GcvT [Clostridiales bacterium]|nr:glycine cleavage system aminomethyltransferase GcvT [Clostridiales bacterium]
MPFGRPARGRGGSLVEEQVILKTPLYEKHIQHGGKIVPFAGYYLPVQYPAGVIAEHKAVREGVGLFDVSHMGEVAFEGRDALANLQNLLCNDFASLAIGRVRYSPMLNPQGGVVDDVLVYRLGEESYWMVVNAANRHKDVAHILAHRFGEVTITDVSDQYCQLALQGPKAEAVLGALLPAQSIPQRYYSFVPEADVAGVRCLVSRTGYTGEDGFELYAQAQDAGDLFDALLKAGAAYGLQLCGLGSRDTLRMEAAMPLYGHEMDESVSPLETGLGHFVKLDKPDFIGKAALLAAGEPKRARVGLTITGRGIAREHYPVLREQQQVGITTSGTFIPTLDAPVAMALVETSCQALGTKLFVDIRGKAVEAEVVPLPFYSRKK